MNAPQSGCLGSLPALATMVLVALRLTHVIDWSWWWVLAPLWVVYGLGFVLIGALSVAGFLTWWRVSR